MVVHVLALPQVVTCVTWGELGRLAVTAKQGRRYLVEFLQFAKDWANHGFLTVDQVAALRATETSPVSMYLTSPEISTVSERASTCSVPGADTLVQLD